MTETATVRVQRVMPAAPEVVFDEWLDRESLMEWMCPHPVRVVDVTVEPHVGGVVRFDVDDSGTRVLITGQFLTIDRPHLLRFTWSNSNWPDPTTESIVNVAFEPVGDDETLMSIEHSLLPAEEFENFDSGWTLTFAQLAAALADRRAGDGSSTPSSVRRGSTADLGAATAIVPPPQRAFAPAVGHHRRGTVSGIRATLRVTLIAWEAWRFRRGDGRAASRRQQQRLQALVRHARTASPYYRNLYRDVPVAPIRLTSLPVVSKRDLMEHFDDWVTDPDITIASLRRDFLSDHSLVGARYLGRYHVATTSGTSGEPAILIHDDTSWALFNFVGRRGEWRFIARSDLLSGVLRRGLRVAALFVADGHVGASAALESARRRSTFLAKRARVFSVLRPLRDLVQEINEFQPTVLEGYPSALALLAAEQRSGRLTIQPLLAITAGERLTAERRAEIESTFGCPVENRYASAEFPGLSMECRHGSFHVNSDWYLFEPVDEDYQPVAPGVASHTVLVTNLANRLQPLIRYDLGDRVTLADTPCACGNRLPAITVEGRTSDLLSFDAPDGRAVTVLPLALVEVIENTPGVYRCQAVRTGPRAVRVRLEMSSDADSAQVWHAVDERLQAFFAAQGTAPVAVEHAAEPPTIDPKSGKFRQVWSAR